MTFLKLLGNSIVSFLTGAAVFAAVMGGLVYALAAPLMVTFGWFFLIPVAVLVSLAWLIWQLDTCAQIRHRLLLFLGGGCVIGGIVMGIIAAGGVAREPELAWAWAFPCAGATTGSIACYLVTLLSAPSPAGK